MIPGLTTKLSETNVAAAASIFAKSDIVRITDTTSTTQLTTIVPGAAGFSQVIFLQNKTAASITLLTTGNIVAVGSITVLSNRMAVLVFSKLEQKWSVCNDT
jgi:hypothetical protein